MLGFVLELNTTLKSASLIKARNEEADRLAKASTKATTTDTEHAPTVSYVKAMAGKNREQIIKD